MYSSTMCGWRYVCISRVSMSCRCGLAACGKKLLSVLPYIGDDEDENSDADFEVRQSFLRPYVAVKKFCNYIANCKLTTCDDHLFD